MPVIRSRKRFLPRICFLLCLLVSGLPQLAWAVEEPYVNELKGSQVAAGNFFTVSDEKFNNPAAWAMIQQNIEVNDILSFEINFDTSIYFYNKPFHCTANFTIYIYGNPTDTSEITDSITHRNFSLDIRYDTVTGKSYKAIALYKFKGVHKYTVKINSITSPDLDPLPAIFRVRGQIIVNRKYHFQDNSTDITRFSWVNNNSQLLLSWTPSNYPGAESFDLEYTHIDDSSSTAQSIRSYLNGSDTYKIPTDSLAKWFKNNSTRINTPASSYLLNMPFDKGFILFRIRGVQIHYPDDVRWEGVWNYEAKWSTSTCTANCASGVVHIDAHEANLNWQYSAVFAEEGKKKEVISYFDGTLHNRQSVTINNSDNKAVVEETIYDVLGRPAVNILPSPADDSTFHFFRNFNQNGSGKPYSYADFITSSCLSNAQPLNNTSGASQYYSENNPFIHKTPSAKYIPKAEGYPFSVTEYTADNTGRMLAQGGVGPTFQINSGHETKYFYDKPKQRELDRLFGAEAGHYSHYLKNMVVDPNGQVSVSYIAPSGKTVATALAGGSPPNLHGLESASGASERVTNELVQPNDFVLNTSDFSLTASTNFGAAVTGTYVLNYKVDPLRLDVLHGPYKDSVICNTCYYDLEVLVKDDCNNTVKQELRPVGAVFDTTCAPAVSIQGVLNAEIEKIGTYYVTYRLKISKQALDFYDTVHLRKNSDIRKYESFLLEELKETDFFGCYNDCNTCLDKLGTPGEFVTNFKALYFNESLSFTAPDSLWTLTLYDSLLANCQAQQPGCKQNVCDEKLDLLKMDVSPGGQYALHDSTGQLLEVATNILARRNEIAYFTNEEGIRDSVTLVNMFGEDSVRVDVKELSDSLFITNWKDRWADSLVRLHPEYCYYLWCLANSNSYAFDATIQNSVDADDAIANHWFDPSNYKALLDKDPFFTTINGVSGLGVPLYQKMSDSLRLFSRTFLRLSQSDKNILQFIDVLLYCKDKPDGWDGCRPDDDCRSRNREWELYKQFYINLKQLFYEEARRASSNSTFANCTNCYLGKDLFEQAGVTCTPPPVSDFSLSTRAKTDSVGVATIVYRNGLIGVPSNAVVTVEYNLASGGKGQSYIKFSKGETRDSLVYNPLVRDSFTIVRVACDSLPNTPYSETTCNYTCPTGIYAPYDRPGLSFFIQYGSRRTSPSSVPAGYTGCRFYPVIEVKTGVNSSCKFMNVWVCVYDSTASSGSSSTPPPSSCADDPHAVLYKNKDRRYPEYVNTSAFIDQVISGNPQDASRDNEEAIKEEVRSTCEGQADTWISKLQPCTTDAVKLQQLREAFIEICAQGSSVDHPFGVSSMPDTITAPYHSFEEAIIGILGAGAINDTCAVELLDNPYPYNRQPVYEEQVITETNYEICQKISQLQQGWKASGTALSFHGYLQQQMGAAYSLNSTELDDIIKSCTTCNGILQDNIVLPVVLEPNATSCLTCNDMQTAMAAFNAKFPGLTTMHANYETLLTNFLNHRFGFALSFVDYLEFLNKCTAGTATLLCNKPVKEEFEIDPLNECMVNLFNTALTNARNRYEVYIDSVRRDFRDAYLTRCMNVEPSLQLTADLFEYHYTLYYYDQSGNLVKTIPPQGVQLLSSIQLDSLRQARLAVAPDCAKGNALQIGAEGGHISYPASPTFSTGVQPFSVQPFSLELFLKLSTFTNQGIFSNAKEIGLTTDSASIWKGYALGVKDGKLHFYLSEGLDDTTGVIAAQTPLLNKYLVPNQWAHIVAQRSTTGVMIYLNGVALPLTYPLNQPVTGDVSPVEGTTAYIGAAIYPGAAVDQGLRQAQLKHVRLYKRTLIAMEVRQNLFNNCFLPASTQALAFWEPLTDGRWFNEGSNTYVYDRIARTQGRANGTMHFLWPDPATIVPDHTLATTYHYNSLNQVVQQYSPDGDTTHFWYDRLGRLIASQNREQRDHNSYSASANRFSITKYDAQGRITEVAEKSGVPDIRSVNLLDTTATVNWMAAGTHKQVTKTIYDNPLNTLQTLGTSRKRVTGSIYLENATDIEGDSTLYAYDINGNVKTLLVHNKALVAADNGNGKKRIDYEYDLVSGKVNVVRYQPGRGDQFLYRYNYDADNRLTRSYSSRDGLLWNEDASYNYYLHGPLARMELGQLKVQGVDYAYTLQGWLKGINSDALNPAAEMSGDGQQNTVYSRVSRDVYGFKLGYYTGDYTPIGGTTAPAFGQHGYTAPGSREASGNQLFNGNISYTTLALSKIGNGATTGYTYGYDQLNRLKEMREHSTTGAWSNSSINSAYSESIAYDANGNILKYLRHGAANKLEMDSLTYQYNRDSKGRLVNNRLNHVRDAVGKEAYTVDIDNQNADNYTYDAIGNLKKDVAEGINNIDWTVYGKIKGIAKTGTTIQYGYDPTGNRIVKQVASGDTTRHTYYVRDAQGNTMAVYSRLNNEPLKWEEQHLYGSSRLGLWRWDTLTPTQPPVVASANFLQDSVLLGSTQYELSNHLGNVLATISDKKIGVDSSGVVKYYEGEVLSQNDYYPGGMQMPGVIILNRPNFRGTYTIKMGYEHW